MSTTQQEIATPDSVITKNVRHRKFVKGSTRWLTYTALFSALAIVMKIVGQYLTLTPSFKITLIYTVWLIAGAVLGAVGGGAVCFISDVLGAFIVPMGAMNPLMILGNTFYGVLAALVFKFTPSKHYVVKFLASGIACTVVCTCLINSLSLWYWYKYYETLTFWQYFVGFRAMQPAVAAINIAITLAMIPLLKRLNLLPEPKRKKKAEISAPQTENK